VLLTSEVKAGGMEAQYLFERDRRSFECIAGEQPRTKHRSVGQSYTPLHPMGWITHKGDDVRWFSSELVRQLLIVGDQVCNINVAIILLYEHILPKLVSEI
jgi:hypothetical protein